MTRGEGSEEAHTQMSWVPSKSWPDISWTREDRLGR
jgi:hypothetical protein